MIDYTTAAIRIGESDVFHTELGYWLWDAASETVMQTLTIPRGVSLTAGGSATGAHPVVLEVRAALGDPDWAIAQPPALRERASTLAFAHRLELDGDQISYAETTTLEIYGRRFEHTDENTLRRT